MWILCEPPQGPPSTCGSNTEMCPPKKRASSRKEAPKSLLSASWLLPGLGHPPFPGEHVTASIGSPRCDPRPTLDPLVPSTTQLSPSEALHRMQTRAADHHLLFRGDDAHARSSGLGAAPEEPYHLPTRLSLLVPGSTAPDRGSVPLTRL